MGSTMGQKIPCRRSPPTLCFLHCILKSAGFCFAISDHAVLLKDQSDVVIMGTPEPVFQPQTLVTGFHWLPQALWTGSALSARSFGETK